MSSLSPSKSNTSIDTLEPEVLNSNLESSQTFAGSVELDVVTRDSVKSNSDADDLLPHQTSSVNNSNEHVDLIDPSEEVLVKNGNFEPSINGDEVVPTTTGNNSNVPQSDQPVWVDDDRKYSFNANYNSTFHRRFPQIDPEEKLIDYFSCALLADILLQGFLYISENYFGFYSNILGYKTKVLIQMNEVRDITKEKTAIIIPNAIGVETHSEKYVFGSLFSRDTTYRLMVGVWRSTLSMNPLSYDQPVESVDNGKESPVTPGSDVLLEEEMNLIDPRHSATAAINEDSNNITIKGQSLSRSIPLRAGTSTTFGRENLSDYDSKLDTEDDTESNNCKSLQKVKNHKSKCQKFPCRLKRHWSSYVDAMKKKYKEFSDVPSVYLVILVLLIYLSISTCVLFVRIGALQDFLDTATHKSSLLKQAKFSDVRALKAGLKENIEKILTLKDNLNEILDSVNRVSSECLAYTKTALHFKGTNSHCEK